MKQREWRKSLFSLVCFSHFFFTINLYWMYLKWWGVANMLRMTSIKFLPKMHPTKKLLELKVGVLPCHIERIQQKPKSATKVPSRINCIDRKCWAVCFTCNVKLTKTWKWEGWIQLMRKWFFTKDCVVAKSQN